MMRRKIPRGHLHQIPVKVRLLQQITTAFLDDPAFLPFLDRMMVKAWKEKESQIPVRTGTLKRALTDETGADSARRKVLRRGRSFVVFVDHPGAKYHPRVVPAVDTSQVMTQALALWKEDKKRRSRASGGVIGRLRSLFRR